MGTASGVAGAIGTALGSAATAPLTGTAAIMSAIAEIAKPLIDLIPDPQKKLEAQLHVSDQSYQLALAQLDQQNKILTAASANIQADPHSSGARAYYCYGVTTLILANYGLIPLFDGMLKWHLAPFQIPSNVLWIFATIMLGFVGVPSVMETLKTVMGMPGESQVNVLGMKMGNKS